MTIKETKECLAKIDTFIQEGVVNALKEPYVYHAVCSLSEWIKEDLPKTSRALDDFNRVYYLERNKPKEM
jgi:hypothetical protein